MAANLEEQFPSLPLTTANRAQLDRVGYVADDLAALRARLLARMAETFPQWNPALTDNAGDPDFGVLFVDLFAQMTTILNAYSDARVNESLLRTAQLERSLIDLAQLVDYRLAPGASAAGLQAFIARDGGAGELPANFKVQSPGTGGAPAVIFETLAPLAVSSVRNRLRHVGFDRSSRKLLLRQSSSAVQDASALLDARYRSLKPGVPLILDGLHAGVAFQEALPLSATSEEQAFTRVSWAAGAALTDRDAAIADLKILGRPRQAMRLVQAARADELALGMTELPVATLSPFTVGDVVMVAGDGVQMGARLLARSTAAGTITLNRGLIAPLRRSATRVTRGELVGHVTGRIRPGTTSFAYVAATGSSTPQAGDLLLLADDMGVEIATVALVANGAMVLSSPVMRAMRVSRQFHHGGGFTLSGVDGIYLFRIRATDPPHTSVARAQLLSDLPSIYQSGQTTLELEKTYEGLVAGALVAAGDGLQHRVHRIHDTRTIDGRTRLTLAGALTGTLRVASLQIHADFEYTMRVEGFDRADTHIAAGVSQLDLLGTALGFTAGMHVILDDGAADAAPEGARLTQVAEVDGHTRVSLARPLQRDFSLARTVIYGNVAPASHGVSVAAEILGSGDPAVSGQRFELRRSPLSFMPDPTRPRGVAANLEVFVDDKRWSEVETLADSAASDEHYVLEMDDSQKVTVVFGDGVHGAAPASGRNNIRARYRVGLGTAGNVAAGQLRQMPQALPFVTSTLNPVAIGGGAERETPAGARRGIRARVRTLERAVSLSDYADLALTVGGVAKARADYGRDAATGAKTVLLTVAANGGAPLSPEARESLHAFFRQRSARRPALVILDARRVAVRAALAVTVLPDYLLADVQRRALQALGGGLDAEGAPAFFSFDRRDLGADLHLSELYAVIEAVRGVDHALANAFHPESAAPSVQDRIRLEAGGWASGGDAVDAAIGRLTVSFSGGVL